MNILQCSRDRRAFRLLRLIFISNIFFLSFVFLNTTTPLTEYVSGVYSDAPQIIAADRGLSSVKHRYYIYNSTALNVLIAPPPQPLVGWHGAVWSMYQALASHPLRTHDPNEATFFFMPLFVNAIDPKVKAQSPQRTSLLQAFDLVTSSQIYQETGGARHIIIAMDGWYFNRIANYGIANDLKRYSPEWLKVYNPMFWDNMTCTYEKYMLGSVNGNGGSCLPHGNIFGRIILARERDVWENHRMIGDENDFKGLIAYDIPIPQRGFSIGLWGGPDEVPLIHANYSKYILSEHIYFYHSRPEASGFDSTKYRHAPMTNLPVNGTEERVTYSESSIGFDINATEWLDHYTNSKYCLVVRGDNPGSRALIRSIRVGCIPVVISDLYPRYAPSYKSTLRAMSEYAILVDEKNFLDNPWGELHRIYKTMTEENVRRKIKAMAFAQRVIFPDHPESLFVEAFLKEAWLTLKEEERVVGCGNSNTCAPFEDTDVF